ncbi:MAG: hypothetical protein J7J75_02475 [Euryarchaeota archaeon]|nr:hypothetical protein [Euryarchaeota archaeon]
MKKLIFVTPKSYEIKRVDIVDISNYIYRKISEIAPRVLKTEIFGSSPPEVFIGRIGYPRVYIGPLVPPEVGSTESLGLTELWFGKPLEEIISMRLSMVRGKSLTDVKNLENKIILELHDMLLSRRAVDTEIKFSKAPRGVLFSFDSQPFGPSAPIEKFKIYPSSSDHLLERTYYDTDLNAGSAVLQLYFSGEPVSRIQQALSAGMLGTSRYRRLVPTRWSITAVDDIISKHLLNHVRQFPVISEYEAYYLEYLDNRWIVVLMPRPWEYESIEAFLPGTLDDRYLAIGGDYESYLGRSEYASIGGCYYAARLAIAERLYARKRQAAALVLREAHPGYKVPVGVWNVRESVRNALKQRPIRLNSVSEILEFISSKMTVPINIWVKQSVLLRKVLSQRTLFDFLK